MNSLFADNVNTELIGRRWCYTIQNMLYMFNRFRIRGLNQDKVNDFFKYRWLPDRVQLLIRNDFNE